MSQHCEFQWQGQGLKFMYMQITQNDGRDMFFGGEAFLWSKNFIYADISSRLCSKQLQTLNLSNKMTIKYNVLNI
jgi:hypothetical protein